MKARWILFLLLFPALQGVGQETQSSKYVFYFADVEVAGKPYRYFSTIMDHSGPLKPCIEKSAKETILLKAGSGAVVGEVEFESSGSFEEAEKLILHKYTLPERKVVYFKLLPDC